MSIRTRVNGLTFLLLGAAFCLVCQSLGAKTVEVEEEDDILAVPTAVSKIAPAPFILKETIKAKTPTPSPSPTVVPPQKVEQAKPATPSLTPKAVEAKKVEPAKPAASMSAPAAVAAKQEKLLKAAAPTINSVVEPASSMPRVRIDDNVGFYYFMKSGFMVGELSEIVSLGQISSEKGDLSYSTPKKCRVKLTVAGSDVKAGDQLVVYRISTELISEPQSGFSGLWARNLAVLTVLELDGSGCLAEVARTFYPFQDGDKVKVYSEESARWKQAQAKKPLPSKEIHCFVAGGETEHDYYAHTEFVVLTAGTDQGVVEGQKFQLRGASAGREDSQKGEPVGLARVFYVGTNYSMAQIGHTSTPIQKGFEAYYQP